MKSLFVLLLLTSCGYSSRNNELIGQVKRVHSETPLICPDYDDVDISLGVIRNGVGSMSNQDVLMYIQKLEDTETLKRAAESGNLVRILYDRKRLTFCVQDMWIKKVEIIQ